MSKKLKLITVLFILISVGLLIGLPMQKSNAAASDIPKTIKTEDTKSTGVKINLIDYETEDSPNNFPNNHSTVGINQYTDLYFFGQGGSPSLVGDENTYTGDAIARQGIYKNVIGADGYPVSVNGNSLKALFDDNDIEGAKKVYKDLNNLFKKEDGYYIYDCTKNYAYYDVNQGNGGDFVVYNDTYDVYEVKNMWELNNSGNKTKAGFFPFDQYNPSKTDMGPTEFLENMNYEGYNHHFALTVESNFFYAEGGKVDGKDIIFNFTGDDDAFIYIDDVLVLDLGGIHHVLGGTINLTTGEVSVTTDVTAVEGHESEIYGKTTTIDEIFAKAGKTFDKTEYSKHALKFYYIERGGCYSNASIKTNVFDVVDEGKVDIPVEVTWSDIDQLDHASDNVEVKLFSNNELVEDKVLVLNKDNNWKGTFTDIPRFIVDENGEAIFIDYTIQQKEIPGYVPYYEIGREEEVIEDSYWIDSTNFEDGEKFLIAAVDWTNNNALKGFSHYEQTTYSTFTANSLDIIDTHTQDANGNTIYESNPLDSQVWTAHNNGNEHQWQFENNGKYLALTGTSDNDPDSFELVMVDSPDKYHDEGTDRYYNTTFWFDFNSRKLMCTVYFDNGESALYYISMSDQGIPDVTTTARWGAQLNIYKRVDLTETVTNINSIKIENRKEKSGSLIVKKTVITSADPADKEYKFTIEFENSDLTGRYGALMFRNGSANFTLKKGESIEISSLPVNLNYKIYEIDESTEDEITKIKTEGVIEEDETIESEFKQVGNYVAPSGNGQGAAQPAPQPAPQPGTNPNYNTPKTGDTDYRANLIKTITIACIMLVLVYRYRLIEVIRKKRVPSILKIKRNTGIKKSSISKNKTKESTKRNKPRIGK